MDQLFLAGGSEVVLIVARLTIIALLVWLTLSSIKAKMGYVSLVVRVSIMVILAGLFFFTFRVTPYLPKNTVEDVRSQEYVSEKKSHEVVDVQPSQSDKKAQDRKSTTDIREEFAKHPDKK